MKSIIIIIKLYVTPLKQCHYYTFFTSGATMSEETRHHSTYHTKLFVLRTVVRNNGELAKIDSARKELQLSAECPRLSLYSVVGEVEAVLKRFGVSNISGLWCDDAIYFQVEKKSYCFMYI